MLVFKVDCGSGVTDGVVWLFDGRSGSGWTDVSARISRSLQCEMRENHVTLMGFEGIFGVHYKFSSIVSICDKFIFANYHLFFTK